MNQREHADVTQVTKRGEMYTIKGVANGQQAAFHIDAATLDSMPTKSAKEFMKRTIRNITRHENG